MRIAINVEQLFYRAPGGTGRYAARLVSSLAREFSGDLIVPFSAWHRRGEAEEVFTRFGLPSDAAARLVRAPLPRPALFEAWNSLAFPGPGLLSSKLRGADVVHAPLLAVPPVRCPLVVTVHDTGFALFPESYPRRGLRFHSRALQRVAGRAKLVVTATHAAAAEIVEHSRIREDRLRVVPHGVDHRVATPEEKGRALERYGLGNVPYVLWVGSLEPRKNVGAVVRAFARLGAGHPMSAGRPVSAGRAAWAHRLVLAGPLGWLHQGLIADSERAALGERLRILGAVGEDDLRGLYAGAALFAFPSLHEGFGMPALEAMVQGTPVVCSDLPALREVTGGAAVLVPPDDIDQWAGAIEEVAAPGARREALVSAGLDRAREFSWGATARMTHRVYEEALA
ncbi:MAG: glycosyltransferase family 4 protein [Acidimicrobiales bacterium]